MSLAIHILRLESRWRLETFSEDEKINKAVVQTNTKKTINFGLLVFIGGKKTIFMLSL